MVFAVETEAGVVDQDIDGRAGPIQRFDQGWRRAGLAEIAGEDLGADAVLLLQFVGQPLEPILTARRQNEIMAVFGQQFGEFHAQPG